MILGFMGEYRWLSNFHLKPIHYLGYTFPSTENAYMAAKTPNIEEREKFINLTPIKAKKLGQKIELYSNWEDIKLQVMYEVNKEKFKDGIERDLLIKTGNEYLVEWCWWHDRFWGYCLGEEFKTNRKLDLPKCYKCGGGGSNNLGKILMKIREEIQ